MKVIVVYSTLHTGTWSLVGLLETTTDSMARISGRDMRRGIPGLQYVDDVPVPSLSMAWLQKYVLPYQAKAERGEIVLFHFHDHEANRPMYWAIKDYKPEVPVLVPMRDPALAFLSWMYRDNTPDEYDQFHESEKERFAEHHMRIFRELLYLSDEHRFLYPFGLSETAARERRALEVLEFCGLAPREQTLQYIKDWPYRNRTNPGDITDRLARTLRRHGGESVDPNLFEHPGWDRQQAKLRTMTQRVRTWEFRDIKRSYLGGDPTPFQERFPVQWEYMVACSDIRDCLEHYGYDNLLW